MAVGGGLKLDDVELIVELGAGGSGRVFAGYNRRLNRRVAVKVLDAVVDDAQRERFDAECQHHGPLSDHDHIVTVHNAGYTADSRPYIEMELIDGGSLLDHVQTNGPVPWRQAVEWVLPICDAVGAVHERGVLHRDLKPANILLSAKGPKLADFGIACLRDELDPVHSLSVQHAPPEAIRNERDVRSDVYSLASTLYELVAGHAPLATSATADRDGALAIIAEAPIPRIGASSAPDWLNDLLAEALAKDPAERPQTMTALAERLTAGLDASPVEAGSAVSSGPATSAPAVTAAATSGRDLEQTSSLSSLVASRGSDAASTGPAAAAAASGSPPAAPGSVPGDTGPGDPGRSGEATDAVVGEPGSPSAVAVASKSEQPSAGSRPPMSGLASIPVPSGRRSVAPIVAPAVVVALAALLALVALVTFSNSTGSADDLAVSPDSDGSPAAPPDAETDEEAESGADDADSPATTALDDTGAVDDAVESGAAPSAEVGSDDDDGGGATSSPAATGTTGTSTTTEVTTAPDPAAVTIEGVAVESTVSTGRITFTTNSCTTARYELAGPSLVHLAPGWPDAAVRCWNSHGHTFTGLEPDTEYVAIVTARDADGGEASVDSIRFRTASPSEAVSIVPPSRAEVVVGETNSWQLVAQGGSGDFTWASVSLPAGYSLSASGLLQFTPSSTAPATVRVRVTDRVTADTADATFTVVAVEEN